MAENFTVITPEAFKHCMNKLLMSCKEPSVCNADIYHAIYEATFLMCATLQQLGYEEGVKIFEELCLAPKPEKSKNFVTSLN